MSQSQSQDIQDAISGMTITNNGDDDTVNVNDPSFLLGPWKDITSFLDEATQEMEEGELVHLQSFTLFDAMGAIEIMDPRMDTGMVLEDSESMAAPYDIHQVLTPAQCIWIMDRLTACQMTWLSGHSLAQTVYTCIYFHHVREIQNKRSLRDHAFVRRDNIDEVIEVALDAYILASVKCCYHIWNEMVSGNIFEEEDFTTNLFGLSLHEDILDTDLLVAKLVMVMDLVKEYMRRQKSSKVLEALHQRLTIQTQFLVSVSFLDKSYSNDAGIPEDQHWGQIDKAYTSLKKLLHLLEDTASKHTPIFETLDLAQEVEGAFDPNIHRKLTSQAPPRSISLLSHQQSYRNLQLMAKRLESICTIIRFGYVSNLMNYFDRFAASTPYPDAYSRSKLSSMFHTDCCIFGHPIINLVKQSIYEFIQPPFSWIQFDEPTNSVILTDAKSSLKLFLEQTLCRPFVDFFKIQCHNRARQRRILCKVIGEWEIIQDEARLVDKKFHDAVPGCKDYFSSWVYNMKMRMMEQILLLGFELDLYGEGEYPTIYWYLQSVLEYGDRQLENDNNKHNHIDIGPMSRETFELMQAYKRYTHRLMKAKKSMATGTFKLLQAVKKTGQWKQQQLRFDDLETRFTHRLKPFMSLSSPPFPGFDRFKKDSAIDYLITDATEDFLAASNLLKPLLRETDDVSGTVFCYEDSQKVLLSMVKTCVTNNIVIQQLLQSGGSQETNVTVAFKHHPSWPILELNK